MSKPTPLRIKSDDCAVPVGGEVFYPHEGESVEVIPAMSIGEMQAFARLTAWGVQMLAAQGEPDEAQQTASLMNDHFEELCRALADRVTWWDWTDLRGRPLPDLDGSPDPFKRLQPEELTYLAQLAKGETPAQEKNGSRPSLISGSDSTSPPSRTSSGEGRNRTRG